MTEPPAGTTEGFPYSRDRMVKSAGAALHAAMADDWGAVSRALQTLIDECGGEGVIAAMSAWCDTLLIHTHDIDPKVPLRLLFVNADTGDIGDADDVPPEVRWAGRLVAARAAMDKPTWDALIDSIPHDDSAISRHISVLLRSIVTGLKAVT